jgi:hypothetical protein
MDKKSQALAILKAIAHTENGGKIDLNNLKAGKTGEAKSLFQFTPDTWKAYSKQVTGQDNMPLTPENEVTVVHKKVSDWVDKGFKPEQIASMWNAGEGEPDAHTGKFSDGSPSTGTNKKYGVKFDVPSYAKKVVQYTNQFSKELTSGGQPEVQQPTANSTAPTTIPPATPEPEPDSSGLLSKALKAKKANPGLLARP